MSADTRLAADLRVSGDRSVGSAVNSVVVTGNGNVVLLVDGREFTRVAVPESGVAATGLQRGLRRVPELVAGVRALATAGGPALLVVDYAENVAPVVAELLDTIADIDGLESLRLLLLARSPQGWWRELAVEHP